MTDLLARRLSFIAPAAVMSAWATVMLHTVASGHINRLLSPFFRNYVLIAAVVLLVLSALYLVLYQPVTEPAPGFAPTGRLRQFGRWLVLLIPLVAAAVLSPSALSSTTLENRGLLNSTAGVTPMPTWNSTNQQNVKAALEADPNQPVPVEVTDLIALSRMPQQMAAFDGRRVRVVGFLTRAGGGDARLVRGMMWCCAADVQPVSVELSGSTTGAWKDTEWLEVVGKARFPSTLGRVIPQVEVETISPTQEPDEPYLSP